MSGSLFGGCCGFGGDMPSLADKADPTKIINLDSYVKDWAYEEMLRIHEATTSCFSGEKIPKRKDLIINVGWDKVKFEHDVPDEMRPSKVQRKPEAEAKSHGNESVPPVIQYGSPNSSDQENKKDGLHYETFSVKFDNTTEDDCSPTLSSEKKVKAIYEVDVHQSVQIGHTLQLSLKVGGDETPASMEASYEFNKMLEHYKGEKKTEEMETTLNTDCPITVKKNRTTEAMFVTSYQSYKKTLHITSTFSGDLNIAVIGKKKGRNGRKFYKLLNNTVSNIFEEIKDQGESPLADMIKIDGEEVSYNSSATFCSCFGVDQHVTLNSRQPDTS